MKITEKLQHKFALSRQGTIDMKKACLSVTVTNLALMMPAGVLYSLIKDLLNDTLSSDRIPFYVIASATIFALIALTNFIQYNATFLSTYRESGIRRTKLAERLRKLPLSYFGKKNIADLTTTIMSDCAQIETASSHWIPEFIGAMISTALVGIGMFVFFDYRIVFASFWVIPAAFLTVWGSSKYQQTAVKKNNSVKMELSDGIQECLESIRDLRSNNAQDRYMETLDRKIKNVEKQAFFTELKLAVCVNSGAIILKLGIATTALVGGILLAKGEIDLLTFFMFLMLVSRLYDPMQITLQNFAAIIATTVQCERLDEILSHEIQTGADTMHNDGYDIVFDHVSFSYNDDVSVLNDVSFTAKQGEVTALIGPSGGGKTTVSRLAARFWDVTGGERQRISIARAFLKDSPIILLDEASASLDVENETAIQTALSKLIENKTVIIIAHRMRTVSGADKIVVLSDGTVKESGKPDDLLKQGGIFARMVQAQTEGEKWTIS